MWSVMLGSWLLQMRGDRSIALALCGAGFHTWLLDLRGRHMHNSVSRSSGRCTHSTNALTYISGAGLSSSPAGDWGLQTYVDLDAKVCASLRLT